MDDERVYKAWVKALDEIEKKDKEIERLRKALTDIDDITPDMADSLTSATDIFQTTVKIIEQALKEE